MRRHGARLGVVGGHYQPVELHTADQVTTQPPTGVCMEERGVGVPFVDRTEFPALLPLRGPFPNGERQVLPAFAAQNLFSCR